MEIAKEVPLNISLGIILDTENKKILIIKRKKESPITGLTWCFPGGRIKYDQDLENELKRRIKEKTGFDVESLGAVYAKTHREKEGLLSIYYLCEVIRGEENLGEEFEEMRWVNPEEIEGYFGTVLHPNLKEYLFNLK